MARRLRIAFEGTHFHIHASGASSYPAKLTLWREVVKACEKHGCFNLLGEFLPNSRPLGTMEAYDIHKVLNEAGVTSRYRIAWVIPDSSHLESMSFAETVFRNNARPGVRAFADITSAKRWLVNDSGTFTAKTTDV